MKENSERYECPICMHNIPLELPENNETYQCLHCWGEIPNPFYIHEKTKEQKLAEYEAYLKASTQ